MNPSNPPLLISPALYQNYPDFPNLWMPEKLPFLFIICAPTDLVNLDEKTYLELIQARLDGMIQDWVSETSLAETQKLLSNTLDQLDSAQPTPILTASTDNDSWRQEWANLLIHDNWRFQERMWHYGITFPMKLITDDDPTYPDLIEMHDDTTLEEWLMTLTP